MFDWAWLEEAQVYSAVPHKNAELVVESVEGNDLPPYEWRVFLNGVAVAQGEDETVYGCRFAAEEAYEKHRALDTAGRRG